MAAHTTALEADLGWAWLEPSAWQHARAHSGMAAAAGRSDGEFAIIAGQSQWATREVLNNLSREKHSQWLDVKDTGRQLGIQVGTYRVIVGQTSSSVVVLA